MAAGAACGGAENWCPACTSAIFLGAHRVFAPHRPPRSRGAAGQISTLSTQAKSTLSAVEQTSSKLKSGFEKANAYKELKSS
jgi:pyruvate/2-oxoacid:ferredoxin oxidoreductase beta subunit